MANLVEAFGEIERFQGWVSKEILPRSNPADRKVVVGEFVADGRRFEAAVGKFPCQLRLVTEESEPLLFKWAHQIALGVSEIVPIAGIELQLGYIPIAYRSDLARLPESVIDPLICSFGDFRRNQGNR